MAFTKVTTKLTKYFGDCPGRPWIEQGYSSDITTAAEAKAGEANVQHYITALHTYYDPGTTAKWFQMEDDNHQVRLVRHETSTYVAKNGLTFQVPFPCGIGRGIYFRAELAGEFSYTIEGFSVTEKGVRSDDDVATTSSISASISATPSASLSPTPSASLSVSASISASVSSTPSVSTSPSASISSTPSVSASVSSSPSASISASPSWSG